MFGRKTRQRDTSSSILPRLRLPDFPIFSVDRETEKRQNKVLRVGRCEVRRCYKPGRYRWAVWEL